jgi:hypothetical protein
MKIMRAMLPVLIGILITGCPSEPDMGTDVNGNLKLTGGVLKYVFTNLTITDGEDYEVTLAVDNLHTALIGCHLSGKLYYNSDGEGTRMLAGMVMSVPGIVTADPREYRWAFTAGNKHQSTDENCANPATTPVGASQYFQLEVQAGDSKPMTGDYSINGTITVREKVPGDLNYSQDIVIGGSGSNPSLGSGSILDEYFTALEDAPAGSVLRFYITCANLFPSDSANTPRSGFGIGYVGNNHSNWQNNAVIYIPDNAEPGSNVQFTVDLPVSECLTYRAPTEGYLYVAIFAEHNCKITKCELWEFQ